ncbi:Probable non-ribosomal peptide synthetase PstA [Mycobacteroides abscessus subsp. abscessus]|nr:Probable non-ribosomal peptide synthetase PstA [Mycobacteroides abscessus subsp. abscessus]
MKADATRRLLSMDLGDDDERAEWEEWGNRAALERSAPSLSIPELFAEQVAVARSTMNFGMGRRRPLRLDSLSTSHLRQFSWILPLLPRPVSCRTRWGFGARR